MGTLLGVAVWLAIWHFAVGKAARTLLDRGQITANEHFALVGWFWGFLLLGLSLSLAPLEDMRAISCGLASLFGTAPIALNRLIPVPFLALLIVWIWLGNGASVMSRMGPALFTTKEWSDPPPPYPLWKVRLAVTALAALGIVQNASRMFPPRLSSLCS